jgi:hypothetical protein
MRRFTVVLMVLILFLSSCGRSGKNRFSFPVENLEPASIVMRNYGQALFQADTARLKDELIAMQADFMPFLDADLYDSANIERIRDFVTDTNMRKLYNKSSETFPESYGLYERLIQSVRRYHRHFPGATIPDYYLYISGVQHEAPVMADEQSLVVAMDCYLGQDFIYYRQLGIPMYRIGRMTPDHMLSDIMSEMYAAYIEEVHETKTVLDEMIRAGKKLYFLEAMLPDLPEHILIGYASEQHQWAKKHEGELWAFYVGDQLLYSNDFLTIRKFFGDGPFTQDFSTEAPARLGEWTGWQIVRKYAERNPEMSLAEIIKLDDSQDILSGARYKPKR